MSHVAVHKCKDLQSMPPTLLGRMQEIAGAIRDRAFALFQGRNGNGSELEDWLAAEREVVWLPEAKMVDTGKEVQITLALPGFDSKEIEVSATPDDLVVRADAHHTHEEKGARVSLCEFSNKSVFRRLALPVKIDVNKVSATLDKGILSVVAPKSAKQVLAAV